MSRKLKFNLAFMVRADIEIDEEVIKGVDAEWKQTFYNLHIPEEIAQHIGYNLIFNNATLSLLDGFADRNDDEAKISNKEIDCEMSAFVKM